ncbi:MAG: hypothetical protein AUK29_06170 [Nitrospirae bacterium CG2_30_53_67]|nr:MAG: hypothetical protein AUK29_06170 [Nitrospirae bacterium CG2_30_53_67]
MKNYDESRDSLRILARVDRRQIAYLNAVLESYEGLGLLRTLNPAEGIVCFYVSNPLSEETHALLQSLQKEIGLEFCVSSFHGCL